MSLKRINLKEHPVWEATRAKLMGGKMPQKEMIRCVCSHSKYHHHMEVVTTVRGEENWWGECMNKKECGCEFYQEHTWKGGEINE